MSYQQDKFIEIANAIREKKGTTAPIKPINFASEILGIEVSTGAVEKKEVNFINFKGDVLYSYTIAEIQELTELPEGIDELDNEVPLTFTGWNYSLQSIKDMNRAVDVGAIYDTPESGAYFVLNVVQDNYSFNMKPSAGTGNWVVDWGDGTVENKTSLSMIEHTYVEKGRYIVKVTGSGFVINNGRQYYESGTTQLNGILTSVYLGRSITSIGGYAFSKCYSLSNICFSNSLVNIGSYCFDLCYALNNIILPNSITNITSTRLFIRCWGLSNVILPHSILNIGDHTFYNCTNLKTVILPNVLTKIDTATFSWCYGLINIFIPKSVVSIGSWAFEKNYIIETIKLEATTPPTLQSNSFVEPSESLQILVPQASLELYKTATNWAQHASKIIGY